MQSARGVYLDKKAKTVSYAETHTRVLFRGEDRKGDIFRFGYFPNI